MNRLLDERGFVKGGSSPVPTPTKRRVGRKDEVLKEMKEDVNRPKHLVRHFNPSISFPLTVSQEYVRNVFKDVYDVECDEDFGGYLSATIAQVKAFEKGGEGPDDDDPQWDMRGTKSSAWNDEVIRILTEKIWANFEEQPPSFPPKSKEYWKSAVGEKFARIKAVWIRAQPRMTATGKFEDPDELEERRVEDNEKRLKRIRVRERRMNVRRPF